MSEPPVETGVAAMTETATVTRYCDRCGAPHALPSADGVLCAQCHHGGTKRTAPARSAPAPSVGTAPVAANPIGISTWSQVDRPLTLTRLADLRERFTGEIEWIVEGYLARRELGFLAGAGESLKSWIAAHLAAAIDGRFPWLGALNVHADRVLFVEVERAGNLIYQLNRIEAAERVSLGSERLAIVPPLTLPLSEPEAQAQLEEAIARFRPDVVIINALRDVLGRANENSPSDIAALLRPLGRMAETYGCCILLIDHFNKAGVVGILRGTAAHGGTAQKHNEADFVMVAERPRNELGKAEGPATVSVTKRRAGEPGAAFSVAVRDTADGGVEVRAEVGVKVLSQLAQVIKGSLEGGPNTVAGLAEATGRDKRYVREALAELRAAGQATGEGPVGKAHTYRLTYTPPPIGVSVQVQGTQEADQWTL